MAKSHSKRDSQEPTASTSVNKVSTTANAPASGTTASGTTLQLVPPELSGGELGTLQEILFGKQMVSYSNQISSLHCHVKEQLANLQQNCNQQFSELHRKLDEGLKRVSSQVEQNDKEHDKKRTSGLAVMNHSLGVAESRLMTQLSQAAVC